MTISEPKYNSLLYILFDTALFGSSSDAREPERVAKTVDKYCHSIDYAITVRDRLKIALDEGVIYEQRSLLSKPSKVILEEASGIS
jgi:hypothetical protein